MYSSKFIYNTYQQPDNRIISSENNPVNYINLNIETKINLVVRPQAQPAAMGGRAALRWCSATKLFKSNKIKIML